MIDSRLSLSFSHLSITFVIDRRTNRKFPLNGIADIGVCGAYIQLYLVEVDADVAEWKLSVAFTLGDVCVCSVLCWVRFRQNGRLGRCR